MRPKLEILAVFLTGISKFIFMDWLGVRLAFVLTVLIGWTIYVIVASKKNPVILKQWGFRIDNFKTAFKLVLPFGLSALVACCAIGFFRDSINLSWHILPILILYPIWGSIQQFLIIGLVAGNLKRFENPRLKNGIIILVTALLFAIVHFPFYWLILGTFILALFYTSVFLKVRNIFVLGIFHGWLGAIFFYTLMNRDPYLEMLQSIGF